MKFGIRDGMLRTPLDSLFQVAKEIGFDGVEFCIGGNYSENLLWQPEGPARLKALADQAGVEISSLSPGGFASMHPALPDADRRAEGEAMLTHVIEVCPLVDTRDILVPMFPRDFQEWPQSTWDQLAAGFQRLAEVAEKHQVRLNLETSFDADRLLALLDQIGSACVRVYYDTGNQTNRGYDVPGELRKLGDKVGMIHAKDTDRKPLGEGRVDFDGVLAAIREIGYDGYIVLETPVGEDPRQDNAQNLAFVKQLFGL